MTAIQDLPLSAGIDFIFHAIEKERERWAWDLYTSIYPYMILERVKATEFDEFKMKLFQPKHKYTETKTYEEINNEMMNVIASYESSSS